MLDLEFGQSFHHCDAGLLEDILTKHSTCTC